MNPELKAQLNFLTWCTGDNDVLPTRARNKSEIEQDGPESHGDGRQEPAGNPQIERGTQHGGMDSCRKFTDPVLAAMEDA